MSPAVPEAVWEAGKWAVPRAAAVEAAEEQVLEGALVVLAAELVAGEPPQSSLQSHAGA